MTTIQIHVSDLYLKVVGNYVRMKPNGFRHTYTATYKGVDYKNESKAEIQRLLRQAAFRNGEARVKFEFKEV